MRRTRLNLWLTAILCALPLAAHAQWASKYTEHDWRLKFGGNSFGLLQEHIDTGVQYRITTICLGPYQITTGLRAVYVAALILLPFAAVGVVALTRPRRK